MKRTVRYMLLSFVVLLTVAGCSEADETPTSVITEASDVSQPTSTVVDETPTLEPSPTPSPLPPTSEASPTPSATPTNAPPPTSKPEIPGVRTLGYVDSGRLDTLRLWFYEGHTTQVAFSPDGQRLAVSSWEGITIYDSNPFSGDTAYAEDDIVESILAIPGEAEMWGVAWSPDGKLIAGGADTGAVWVWDAETGTTLHTLDVAAPCACSISWSPDGTMLAVSGTKVARVWSMATGDEIQAITDETIISVAWSPDGKWLAGGSENEIKLWDTTSWEKVREFAALAMQGPFETIAWSRDGKRIAGGSVWGRITTWNTETGDRISSFEGHQGHVRAIAWAPDGQRLASVSDLDGAVRLWDPFTGKDIGHVYLEFYWMGLSWSPDGRHLVAVDTYGAVLFWDV